MGKIKLIRQDDFLHEAHLIIKENDRNGEV